MFGKTLGVSYDEFKTSQYQLNREQHIRAAGCRSRFESQWATPNFGPQGANTIGVIKLKNGSIN